MKRRTGLTAEATSTIVYASPADTSPAPAKSVETIILELVEKEGGEHQEYLNQLYAGNPENFRSLLNLDLDLPDLIKENHLFGDDDEKKCFFLKAVLQVVRKSDDFTEALSFVICCGVLNSEHPLNSTLRRFIGRISFLTVAGQLQNVLLQAIEAPKKLERILACLSVNDKSLLIDQAGETLLFAARDNFEAFKQICALYGDSHKCYEVVIRKKNQSSSVFDHLISNKNSEALCYFLRSLNEVGQEFLVRAGVFFKIAANGQGNLLRALESLTIVNRYLAITIISSDQHQRTLLAFLISQNPLPVKILCDVLNLFDPEACFHALNQKDPLGNSVMACGYCSSRRIEFKDLFEIIDSARLSLTDRAKILMQVCGNGERQETVLHKMVRMSPSDFPKVLKAFIPIDMWLSVLSSPDIQGGTIESTLNGEAIQEIWTDLLQSSEISSEIICEHLTNRNLLARLLPSSVFQKSLFNKLNNFLPEEKQKVLAVALSVVMLNGAINRDMPGLTFALLVQEPPAYWRDMIREGNIWPSLIIEGTGSGTIFHKIAYGFKEAYESVHILEQILGLYSDAKQELLKALQSLNVGGENFFTILHKLKKPKLFKCVFEVLPDDSVTLPHDLAQKILDWTTKGLSSVWKRLDQQTRQSLFASHCERLCMTPIGKGNLLLDYFSSLGEVDKKNLLASALTNRDFCIFLVRDGDRLKLFFASQSEEERQESLRVIVTMSLGEKVHIPAVRERILEVFFASISNTNRSHPDFRSYVSNLLESCLKSDNLDTLLQIFSCLTSDEQLAIIEEKPAFFEQCLGKILRIWHEVSGLENLYKALSYLSEEIVAKSIDKLKSESLLDDGGIAAINSYRRARLYPPSPSPVPQESVCTPSPLEDWLLVGPDEPATSPVLQESVSALSPLEDGLLVGPDEPATSFCFGPPSSSSRSSSPVVSRASSSNSLSSNNSSIFSKGDFDVLVVDPNVVVNSEKQKPLFAEVDVKEDSEVLVIDPAEASSEKQQPLFAKVDEKKGPEVLVIDSAEGGSDKKETAVPPDVSAKSKTPRNSTQRGRPATFDVVDLEDEKSANSEKPPKVDFKRDRRCCIIL